MTASHTASMYKAWTLPAHRPRAVTAQVLLLVSAAWLLPALAHLIGLPVRQLLPMHWAVVLAGLCYGWRSGALIGAGAPVVSFMLSGMPPPVVLPAMVVELATYGCVAGLVRQVLHRGHVEAALAAIVAGRILFVGVMLAGGTVVGPLGDYVRAALVPGLPAALAQVVVLPLVARWWVAREQRP
jgi:uncharacterized membrane protein